MVINQCFVALVSDLYDVKGQQTLTSSLSPIMPFKTVDMYWSRLANPIKFIKIDP